MTQTPTTGCNTTSTLLLPRFGSRPRSNTKSIGSYGPQIEAIHRTLTGTPFMPWQRYVCDVAFEHDDAGLCVYRYFVLIVPRQAGKSSLCEAILVWAALHRRRSNVVYAAQTRDFARIRLLEELEMKRLAHGRFASRYHAARGRGNENLLFDTGTHVSIVSTSEDAGHGLTLDMAIIDEAWAHKDFTMIDALDPTMITRPDPMFVITSTVGEGDDALLMHFQEL